MPISLRLSDELESQITGFGARQGLSKSAVIVRSIQEFLARNSQPTSLQIYQDAMRDVLKGELKPDSQKVRNDAIRTAAEVRPHKLQVREAIRSKHAKRQGGFARAGKPVGPLQLDAVASPRSPDSPNSSIPRQPRKLA